MCGHSFGLGNLKSGGCQALETFTPGVCCVDTWRHCVHGGSDVRRLPLPCGVRGHGTHTGATSKGPVGPLDLGQDASLPSPLKMSAAVWIRPGDRLVRSRCSQWGSDLKEINFERVLGDDTTAMRGISSGLVPHARLPKCSELHLPHRRHWWL